MLSARARLLAPGPRGRPVHETFAIAISAALHAMAIGLLLLRPGRELPPPVPPLEIEMVQQRAEIRGTPAPPATAPSPEPAQPQAAAPPSPPAPPLPQAPRGLAASTPASPSSPQARRQIPSPRTAPEVNLGNAVEDLDPLSVTGDNVVPPGPDSRYRNLPPHYPAAAARIGVEGTVQLVAQIAPNGLPLSVGVVATSGNADLDEEARRAVMLWRFRPARENGRAIAYDYAIKIRFALGDP